MKKVFFFFKNRRIVLLLSLIAIVIMCCKSTQPASSSKAVTIVPPTSSASPSTKGVLVPRESDLSIAQAHWPETTLNDLSQGYSIYSGKCTNCHGTKNPEDFTENAWTVIMHQMGRKANLDSTQYKLVLHYILTKREAILGPDKIGY